MRPIAAAALLLTILPAASAAQVRDATEWLEQCRRGETASWHRDRARACEIRELTLPADGRTLTVDGRQNGGISVQSWDRNEILVQALISAVARSGAEAAADAEAIRILSDGHVVRADGPATGDRNYWSVSYRVYVPARTDLDLRARNGGLAVENVSGRIQLETTNGGIRLARVGGDVRGRTVNGGVRVDLAGDRWQGAGLDVRTTNGAVRISMPAGFSAQLETGTTNGRISTDIPVTVSGTLTRSISAQIGQGGPPIRLHTTNGSVQISRS